jgi:hypothetical protein
MREFLAVIIVWIVSAVGLSCGFWYALKFSDWLRDRANRKFWEKWALEHPKPPYIPCHGYWGAQLLDTSSTKVAPTETPHRS